MTWCSNCGKQFDESESHLGHCLLGYGITEGKMNEICPACTDAVYTALRTARGVME